MRILHSVIEAVLIVAVIFVMAFASYRAGYRHGLAVAHSQLPPCWFTANREPCR